MLKIRKTKGKLEVTLGNYQMVSTAKDLTPESIARMLEMLCNNYTNSQTNHHEYMIKYGNLLMDYADIKKKFDEDWKKIDES